MACIYKMATSTILTCECPPGYVQVSSGCQPIRLKVGEDCTSDTQCKAGKLGTRATCTDGKCQCSGIVTTFGKCVQTLTEGYGTSCESNPSVKNSVKI